jgi:hypothetical protein
MNVEQDNLHDDGCAHFRDQFCCNLSRTLHDMVYDHRTICPMPYRV